MLGKNKWPIHIFIRELRSGGKWETIEDEGRRYNDHGMWFLKFKSYKIDKTQVRNDYIEKSNRGKHYAYFFSTSKGNLQQVPPFSTGGLITSIEEKKDIEKKLAELPVTNEKAYIENIQLIDEEIKKTDDGEDKEQRIKELTELKKSLAEELTTIQKLTPSQKEKIEEAREFYETLLDPKNLVFLPRVSTEDEREIVNNAAKRERRWNQRRGFWDKYGHLIAIIVTGIAMAIIFVASVSEITKFWTEMGKQMIPALQGMTDAMNTNSEVMREFMTAFGKDMPATGKPPT